MKTYDAIIIGAGAAGLFCAWQAAQRGLRVVVLEKQSRPGLKILISGGGRCNFTNREVAAQHYVSQNPHFAKSALARFKPEDFIRLVEGAQIPYHEKHRGQLFCDRSAKDILNLLLQGCQRIGVDLHCNTEVMQIEKREGIFFVRDSIQTWQAPALVVATGGLSYPRLGSSDLGYRIAQLFDHKIIPLRPALTPVLCTEFKVSTQTQGQSWVGLAGISCRVQCQIGKVAIKDEILFTHQGFSGPVILRISNYWQENFPIKINFLPDFNIEEEILKAKAAGHKALIKNFLAQYLPKRLAEFFCEELKLAQDLPNISAAQIRQLSQDLHHFQAADCRLAGYDKAEVTAGGVDTAALSSKTMESKQVPGLYFIGEVVDVTGDLGGYNFQWAWASAFAAACKLSTPVPS